MEKIKMKILDNGKEYEEISKEDAEQNFGETIQLNIYNVNKQKVVRYFREVKPAPEFPIKIELSENYYLEIDEFENITLFNPDHSLTVVCEKNNKDINGILKALLYLETEDDIIKRLKELR